MSRSRLPPTPSMSGEFIIRDQSFDVSESSFTLPPAALSPASGEMQPQGTSRKNSIVSYVPVSPPSPDNAAMASNPPRHAGTKRALDEFNLPPPPTRTRKIIQMKPKTQHTPPKPAAPKPKETGKATVNNVAAQPNSKKKQPSATSAAGRKIARKTAHSLIERRRRSKMNEEFGTLKNMIPACRGQEMHKLAILQASIDYVNYLEQCITDLKSASGRSTIKPPPGPPSPTSPEVAGTDESGASVVGSSSASPELRPGIHSGQFSPTFSHNPGFSRRQPSLGFSTPILPSPALGPTRSPDLMRSPRLNWQTPTQPASASASPALLPQQRHSISSHGADTDIDHEASAALLMLNMDRRGTIDSMTSQMPNSASPALDQAVIHDKQKKLGMSVRDLLVS